MPTFKLTEDTIVRLKEQFARFQRDREAVRDRLENYVADYGELRDRRSLDRQEELREKYPPSALDVEPPDLEREGGHILGREGYRHCAVTVPHVHHAHPEQDEGGGRLAGPSAVPPSRWKGR